MVLTNYRKGRNYTQEGFIMLKQVMSASTPNELINDLYNEDISWVDKLEKVSYKMPYTIKTDKYIIFLYRGFEFCLQKLADKLELHFNKVLCPTAEWIRKIFSPTAKLPILEIEISHNGEKLIRKLDGTENNYIFADLCCILDELNEQFSLFQNKKSAA